MRPQSIPSPVVKEEYGCCLGIVFFSVVITCFAQLPGFGWMFLLFSFPAALIAVAIIFFWLYGRILLIMCMRERSKRGIRGIIVYSNSPNWQTYVETHWLPLFGNRFLVLNSSQGDHRSRMLPARVYRHFCPQRENHCPAILLFRGLRHPYVYRFFYTFRDYKHGNPKALRELEAHLINQLGIALPPKEKTPSEDGA